MLTSWLDLMCIIVDIQILIEFERKVPANTEAFALVISDRILQFESDGQKMNVVFKK